MRSTWPQAVSNSVARSLPMRVSNAAEDLVLGLVPHRDDEGKAELRDVGGVELGEQLALLVGQRVEAGGGLFASSIPRSAAWPAASLPARSGWALSTPSRSVSLAARKIAAERIVQAAGACRAPGRARSS